MRVTAEGGETIAEFRGQSRSTGERFFDARLILRRDPARSTRSRRASRDEIAALQRERLAWSLRHAYDNVPHYRRAFDAAGVHPDDFSDSPISRSFLSPPSTICAPTIRSACSPCRASEVARIHASSGTTGKPTVVGYTRDDLEIWAEVMARSIRAAGGRPGMIVHVAYGYGLFTGGLGAHYGAERLGCTVIPVSGGQTERQVQLIRDFSPDIIMVTPSYMLAILDGFRAAGADPRATALKVGIFGAEPWTDAMRSEIEAAFDMHAVDIYGLSEVMGPGVANECVETKDGLHIWEDHFYPGGDRPEDRGGAARRRAGASWCSPRSPSRRCRSCAIAPATSRACCPAPHAPCGGWRR